MNNRTSLQMLVEAGIMVALSMALNFLILFKMPQGGSVTAGSMIPVMIFALRWGLMPGMFAGLGFGILQMILGGYIVHPVQAALDYPLAFMALGLAGVFSKQVLRNLDSNRNKAITFALSGVLISVAVRFVCHVLSGVVFFSEYAGELNPWIYSMIYNGSFLSVEFAISAVLIGILAVPVMKAAKPVHQQ